MATPTKTTQRLMPYSEVCELLNRHYRTIWSWVRDGKFVTPVKMGNRTLGFKREDVEAWLSANQGD